MDAATRERHLRECVRSQLRAAAAHELATSALEVASLASELGKGPWISTACAARETEAIEAQLARDRLLGLIETKIGGAELEQVVAQPIESIPMPHEALSVRATVLGILMSVWRGVAGRT